MGFQFTKAVKEESRLRLALVGPSGSGKTYTALRIAKGLGGKVAIIDTENGSSQKYADLFDFDKLVLTTFSPLTYVEAIQAAETAGYDVVIIDSLSHAWSGKQGALEQVDEAARRSRSGNSYAAWRDVTPQHNRLIDAMVQSKAHVIVTMRAKTEYTMEKDANSGRTTVRKVGLGAVQRDGMEYEFDVVADIDIDHVFMVTKTRCPLLDNKVIAKAGEDVSQILLEWLHGEKPVDVVAQYIEWLQNAATLTELQEAVDNIKAGPAMLPVDRERVNKVYAERFALLNVLQKASE